MASLIKPRNALLRNTSKKEKNQGVMEDCNPWPFWIFPWWFPSWGPLGKKGYLFVKKVASG